MKANWTNALVLMGVTALPLVSPWIDDPKAAVRGDDLSAQVRELGSSDTDVRKRAFEALEKRGEAARAELEKAAKSDDPEMRFNATLLLDRLEDQRAVRQRALNSVGGPRGWLRDSGEANGGDEAQEQGAPPRLSLRRGTEAWPTPFDPTQLEQLHRQLLRRLEGLNGELSPGSVMSRSSEVDGVREKLTIRVEANGRAVAEVERDGKQERYEAESLDTLRAEHPELFEGFGAVQLRTARPPAAATRPKVERLAPGRGLIEREVATQDGPRLGVQVEPIHPAVAEYLELDEGVGLRVMEVVAGSAAEKLGVRRNDLVIEVNGRMIRGVADVQAALGQEKDAAEDAVVTVLRKGVRLDL